VAVLVARDEEAGLGLELSLAFASLAVFHEYLLATCGLEQTSEIECGPDGHCACVINPISSFAAVWVILFCCFWCTRAKAKAKGAPLVSLRAHRAN